MKSSGTLFQYLTVVTTQYQDGRLVPSVFINEKTAIKFFKSEAKRNKAKIHFGVAEGAMIGIGANYRIELGVVDINNK